MTPEEKFNQDVWWTLQVIKRELLSTLTGKNVEINTVRLASRDANSPPTDDISKCIRKLDELGAFRVVEKYDADSYDPYYGANPDWENANAFELAINQPKFDEIYKKYETANSQKEASEQWIKPIIKKIENGKLPYKKDGLFYSFWKYANASRLTRKSLIAFMDLAPLEGNPRFAIFEFLNSLQELRVELEDITFHEDIYKKYCKTEHDYITDYITKNPKADFSKAVKKLFKNQATFDDVFKILGKFDELVKMKLQLNGLLEFVEFSPTPSAKNIKSLKEYLEAYLKCFIEDKLFSPELKNFYRFSRQKEVFLQQIEREVKDYGLEFVFRQGEIISVSRGSVASIGKDEAYLFIHTLAALEKQDYFEIESILIMDMDVPPEKQTDDYKVKILASKKLLEEYEPKISHAQEQIQKIQIISGKLEVDGLKDGLNAIAQSKRETDKPKFPYKLPAGTEWKNFIIQFLNKEEVYIQVNRFKHNESYAKMDFADNRFSIPKPNEGWTFLWVLAKYNGELTIKDPDAKDTYKKQKELVSKALKSYFSMESDPFYPYQETKSYKTRFTLLPPPEKFEEKGKKHEIPQSEVEQDSVDEEIRQYFEEQAPQVYDERG